MLKNLEHSGAEAARVLIVDDSIVTRAAIARMIEGSGRFAVVGAVPTAKAAKQFLNTHDVDVVLLDLNLPGTDGMTAIPQLRAAASAAHVVVVSASIDAAVTARAIAAGAVATLVKPTPGALSRDFADELLTRLDRVMVEGAATPTGAHKGNAVVAWPDLPPFDIVGIGASTGGIHALGALLRAIPPSVDVPILITQHLPHSFTPYFASQLSVLGGRPCDVAQDHLRIRPGRIVIAPGNAHLCVVKTGEGASCRLSNEPSSSGCLPSVDPMFLSLARAFGSRALGIVLSGMGRDGSEGASALCAIGAGMIAQDRGSSVVWGMPGAVVGACDASIVLPPDQIGQLIAAHWLLR